MRITELEWIEMHTRKLVTVWIMIALALTLLPQPVKAEQPAPGQVSVILIMDNSGSMKTSDPADLRFTAVRLFISLLDEGDQVGLILFSTQSHTLTGGLVTLYGEAEKRKLLNQTQFAAADGYTDIKAALLDARDMLPMAQGGAGKTVVILLTDGKPEISQPYAAYEDEALDVARTLGVPVLSIALMTAAQTPFLNRLAAQTGGLVVPAEDAADLLDAYLEVFSQIKDRTVIGSGLAQSPGNAALEIDPALAPYITKVSFILSKPDNIQSKFLAPSGEEITPESSGVASFLADDPRFVVIIMHHPAGGGWNFQLSGQGMVMRRAILHSRLRSAITSPGRFHQAGQPMPIVVSLIEQKDDGQTTKIIGDAAFSALITLPDGKQESLDRFYDDGTHGDARANDGDYTRLFVNTDQPGSYDVAIR
ncbi:MAG: VWA domain-containing protein, partial [Chloroflexi bacterium]|nr:VWA domain-containing protein [Chloroflexota bacterium]